MYGKPETYADAAGADLDFSVRSGPDRGTRPNVWPLVAAYANGLPVMSRSMFRLNELLSRGMLELEAVVTVLSCDPSMAAHVLRLANGSDNDHENKIYRLEDSVVLLGIGRLRHFVLATALAPTDHALTLNLQALSQHCRLTATFCERIAHECGYPEPQRAHVAGLLHDIGKIPLLLAHSESVDANAALVEHCAVGAWLAKLWNFPPFLVDAIEHHHDPGGARRDPLLAAATAAADCVCRAHGVGVEVDPSRSVMSNDCTGLLHRYLPFLNSERTAKLADSLQCEFLCWVKTPVEW